MGINTYLVLLVLVVGNAGCYKILGIFPYHGKSHFNVFKPLMKALVEKGHDVTVISHFPLETEMEGYTDVSITNTYNSTNVFDVNFFDRWRIYEYFGVYELADEAEQTCADLKHPAIMNFQKNKAKFDVVLIEQFNTNCFLPLANAPFIGITSHTLMPWTGDPFGNIDNPSYIPIQFMDYSDRLSFVERLENTVAYIISKIIAHFFIYNSGSSEIKEVFGVGVDVERMVGDMSMILTYTHPTLNRARPLVPGIVEIGGLHINGNAGKLPKNIEKWINESDAGVIYFSMGSMIKGHTFPEDKRQAFLRAFGRLRQRVLWKWENDTMPGKPDNVMIQKWMPQFDILCHPNVKAFISHGGLLGITEAVHCGVPVVAMPQFGDQHTNAKALEAGGGGVVLNFADVDEDTVFNALQTVLDPGFNKKAKDLSERFRDRPMPPMETAIYWIEYVARHKGAHHLRTAAVGMPLYQYLLLDVIAFLILVITIATYITCKITKATFRF